jgi:hypothetical protein
MKLIKEIVLSVPNRTRLPFGHLDNIVIVNIDTSLDDVGSNRRLSITFNQIDPTTGKVMASSSGSYWRIVDVLKGRQAFLNLTSSLIAIAGALGLDEDEFYTDLLGDVIPIDMEIEDWWKTNGKSVKKLAELEDQIMSTIDAQLVPIVKATPKKLLKMKSVVNGAGFFELGVRQNWILSMESSAKLDKFSVRERSAYDKFKENGGQKKKPDAVGSPPAMAEINTSGGPVNLN